MAKLVWNMLGWSYQAGLAILKTCYETSNDNLEAALERAKEEAIGYEQALQQGAQPIGEWEDGYALWTQDQILEENVQAAADALWEVRRAFVIALYHHWERGARGWTHAQHAKHPKLIALVEELGVKTTPVLNDLYLLVNTLKHNSATWGQQLLASRPDLVDSIQVSGIATDDWYEAIRIPHAAMLDMFAGASASGATVSSQFP